MKLTLRTRLIGSFVVMLLLMSIVGYVGVFASMHIKNHMEIVIEQDVQPANILGVVARRVGFIHSNSLLHLITGSMDDMNRYESEIADWAGKINANLDTLANVFQDQATQDKLAEFRTDWETYLRIWNEQVVPLSRANLDEEAFALVRKGGAAGTVAQEAMYKLDKLHDTILAASDQNLVLAKQHFRTIQIILLTIILSAITLGLVFGIKEGSRIAGAVNTVSRAAQLVAAGDLDQIVKVKAGDEIESMADSFNTMTGNLKKMVEELHQEINRRKRVKEALQENEQWLYTTLKSIGDAVIAVDAHGFVTLMNSVAVSLTGWDEAEAVGRPLEDVFNIINEKTGQPVESPAARVLREGVVVGLANHTILIARNGTKRPIADSGAPMRDGKGNFIGTVMVFRDITESRLAEEALQESEEKLNSFMKSAPDSFIFFDPDLNLVRFNTAAANLLGFSAKDIGKNILNILPGIKETGRYDKYLEVLRTGKPFSIVDLVPHPKFGDLHLTVRAFKAGESLGIIVTDITGMKRVEEELVRKEKLAVLGQLSGGVGHELRNPLGVISNAVYFLQMTLSDADETTREYLEIISSEVRNSEKIVSDLLDLSRIKPSDREKIAVSELFDQVLEKQPPPGKVKVNSEIPPELPLVFADPGQMAQVLMNLVTNAYQAMPEGGMLTVGARAEKEKVSLFVTDTGCGISEKVMLKIFEPLFTTRSRGIGLGLPVSRNLVEVNGGTLDVQSEQGRGSTFTVILPVKEVLS
ncbi:MAG: PAS domain S-box protein [Candidatus Sabulitectum sp.]|nr:PAS domain S-box protein [Candidatus Sabulitectum sp.]